MIMKLKKRMIIAFLLLLCLCTTLFVLKHRTVKAEEVDTGYDYTLIIQEYKLYDKNLLYNLGYEESFGCGLDSGIDNRYIFRIDCQDLSSQYPELTELELVRRKYIYLDFDYKYVWFVDGEVKTSHEVAYGKTMTEYVEVLFYDSVKNQIYVRFDLSNVKGASVDTALIQNNREQGQMFYIDPDDVTSVTLLQQRIAELEEQLSGSNQLTQEQAQEIATLQTSLNNLELAYNGLNNKYVTLNEQYLSVLTMVEELTSERNNAIEEKLIEIQAHKETRERLENQIAEKDGNIEELTAELSSVSSALEEKEQELKVLQDDCAELEKQYVALLTEYNAFLESANGDLEAVSQLLHDYKLQIARLEKQVKELTEERDNLRNELSQEENKNGCLSSGCSIGSGGSGGIGSGIDSTAFTTGVALSLFGVVLYVKRKKVRE